MDRAEILSVIKRNILEIVEDIDESDLDPQKSMKDYGATSLDIVEVVSSSMRELRVKVPRSELNSIENIDGLVDALHAAALQKAL
ncbi:MAG: acyl carrier protein [Alphaproteobacteria bacterium]|nr:acyl carrier protein [Alphaproteobacteria bacterium]